MNGKTKIRPSLSTRDSLKMKLTIGTALGQDKRPGTSREEAAEAGGVVEATAVDLTTVPVATTAVEATTMETEVEAGVITRQVGWLSEAS